MFGLLASFAGSWRRSVGVIAAWVVVGVIIILTAPPLSEVTTNNQEDFLPGDSESRRALELVSEKYPRGQGVPAIVVFHRPEGLSDADLAAVAEVDAAFQADGAPDDIESVLSLSGSPEAASALLAPDGTTVTTIVTITGSPAAERFGDVVSWIREQAQAGVEDIGLTVALTGPAGIVSDAVKVFGTFDFRVTLFTVLLVLVLLLLIYRSPALALLAPGGGGLDAAGGAIAGRDAGRQPGAIAQRPGHGTDVGADVRRRHRFHVVHRCAIPRRTATTA